MKVARVLLYLCALAAFFEGSARVALSIQPLFERAAGTDDASYRLAWVRRHAREPDATGLAYAIDVYHPLRGWALAPNLRTQLDGRGVTSNSRGLRGEAEHDYTKPKGAFRVLVFGDSFTFGESVEDQETYAAQLQHLLPGTEVLNLGVHGYAHDQMLLYLKEEGVRYQPDLVVLGFVDWDMGRNVLTFRDYAKPRFVPRGSDLVLTGTPVPTPAEVLRAERYRSRSWDLLTILWERTREATGADAEASRRLTTAILDEFRRTAERAGAATVVAYLPVGEEIAPASGPAVEGERFLFAYCRGRGADCVDLRPAFIEREQAGTHLKTRGHWNRTEHSVAAEALRDHLVERSAALRAALARQQARTSLERKVRAKGTHPQPGKAAKGKTPMGKAPKGRTPKGKTPRTGAVRPPSSPPP